MTWKEYELTNQTLADWLPWSAITQEHVMRCRDDGSVFGIIQYRPFSKGERDHPRMELPSLGRGWCFWIEEQCAVQDVLTCYLIIFWNPFEKSNGMIANAPTDMPVRWEDMEEELAHLLHQVARTFPQEAEARVLSYQGIVDVLSYMLTMGRASVTMPDPPVDLDVVLTQDLSYDFSSNRVRLDGDTYLVVSLPSVVGSSEPVIEELLRTFASRGCPGRHVQRLSLFDEAAAQKELQKYTDAWCSSRKYIKDCLLDRVIGEINGFYNNHLIFLVPAEQEARMTACLEKKLMDIGIPFLIEDFNAKNLWWGSLPAIHTAAVVPPICGFDAMEDLLMTTGERGRVDVSDESFPQKAAPAL